MIKKKKILGLLLVTILLFVLVFLVSCRKSVPTGLPSESSSLQATRVFWQQQTNQARILQTQGVKQPEKQNTPIAPTVGLTDIQSTPTQNPSSSTTSMFEPSNTPPLYPSTEQVSPTQAISNTSIISSRTSTPTNTKTIALSATNTPTFLSSATNTPTSQPSNTSTPTQTKTKTPTLTPTHTPSPTLQTGWGGEWQVFWQLEDQTYIEGTILINVANTDFTAQGVLGGSNYSFTGRIIDEGLTAFGNWTSPTSTGGFIWTNVSSAQFGGSRDIYFGFCGMREGSDPPDPCYIPPLS